MHLRDRNTPFQANQKETFTCGVVNCKTRDTLWAFLQSSAKQQRMDMSAYEGKVLEGDVGDVTLHNGFQQLRVQPAKAALIAQLLR